MAEPINPIKGVSAMGEKLISQAQAARASGALHVKEQIESDESIMSLVETGDFDPLGMGKNFKELYKQTRKEVQTGAQIAEEQSDDPDMAQSVAQQFNKKNPEKLKDLL